MSRDHAKPLSRPAGECCDTPLVFVQANRLSVCFQFSVILHLLPESLSFHSCVPVLTLSYTKKKQYFPIVLLHNKSFQIAK